MKYLTQDEVADVTSITQKSDYATIHNRSYNINSCLGLWNVVYSTLHLEPLHVMVHGGSIVWKRKMAPLGIKEYRRLHCVITSIKVLAH